MRKFGVDEETIDEMLNDEEQGLFAVWPESVRAIECFLAVCRQWRVGPMGGFLGFDYPGVEAVLRMRRIKVDAALLDDLAVMEAAAMEVLNAK